jgi:hypothetical protein
MIKLTCVLVDSKDSEMGVKSGELRAPMLIRPEMIESIRPSYDDDEAVDGTNITTASGQDFRVIETMDVVEGMIEPKKFTLKDFQ